jgi:hypothetical protein
MLISETTKGVRARLAPPLIWLAAGLLGLFALSSYAGPAWWTSRGAVSGTPNPYAAVNQGQLKQFTSQAVAELNADFATFGGAGTALNNLVTGWQQDYATNNYASTSNPTHPYKPSDFQAVNVGQLKYIGSLIYGQLALAGYTAPSWIVANATTDKAVANIGELKTVFNFDLTLDSDDSGLPIWWEMKYFGATGVTATNPAPSNDGLTILQAYQEGSNPIDFYNGQVPTVTITMGNGQTGGAGGFLAQALAVLVNVNGAPASNQTVTFAVTQGGGQVQATTTSNPANTVSVQTNASGIARTFFELPPTAGATAQITATAGNGTNVASVTFTETVGAPGTTVQAAPCTISNLTSTLQPDGSQVFTWSNNTDDPTPIWNHDANGNVVQVTTVPAGQTSYQFTP